MENLQAGSGSDEDMAQVTIIAYSQLSTWQIKEHQHNGHWPKMKQSITMIIGARIWSTPCCQMEILLPFLLMRSGHMAEKDRNQPQKSF